MMIDNLQTMADLLLELERELRSLNLWSEDIPAREALQSTTPFSADHLRVEQWLQWIFVPTIKRIIEQDLPLPERCDIHPYAEEAMKRERPRFERLLAVLLEIDQFITAH